MHSLKTGALIKASIELGILAHQAVEPETKQNLLEYASNIGLAFQIQDDILDVEGETAITGKQQGKDSQHNKPNYPSIIGLAEAKIQVQALYLKALTSLNSLSDKAKRLRELAEFIIERNF